MLFDIGPYQSRCPIVATSAYAIPGHTRCPDCGRFYEKVGCLVNTDWRYERTVCPNCAFVLGFKACDGCGAYFRDLNNCDGIFYCDNCTEENYYHQCNDCGGWIHFNDSRNSDDGDCYCDACYYDRYFHCSSCGNECLLDDCYERDGEWYCSDCRGGIETWRPAGFHNLSNRFDLVGSNRCFGLELETDDCHNHDELNGDRAWGCKNDCSVRGKEFWSDILHGNDGLEAVDRICDFAADNDWNVDAHCGFHLHLDMRNESPRSLKAIAGAAYLTRTVWNRFVNSARITNHYCEATNWQIDDLRAYAGCVSGLPRHRYQWFNLCAYSDHSTYEIRLHEGTLDAHTIKNWTRAWLTFADWAARHTLAECEHTFRGDLIAKFHKLCKIWTDAGCDDLVEWFANKGHMPLPTHPVCVDFENKLREVALVGSGRGIR